MADEKKIAPTVDAEEKQIATKSDSGLSTKSISEDEGQELTWTEEEEKALVKKIDFLVLPILMLAFFALQLDRGNM
jgi:hypothetical protein